jgi:uncharacterized protein involved in outer membrane biogenesis
VSLAALVVIVLVAGTVFLGRIVKAGVERVGPEVTKVPVTLGKADISIFRGAVNLRDLVIGNPEGFKTPHLFRMGELSVKLDIPSVLRKTVVIEKIYIGGPEISYEKSLKSSNIGQLLNNIEGGKPAGEQPPATAEEKPAAEEPGKKVVINDFLLKDARLGVSVTMAGGHAIPVPLPPIHLTDIGKEKDGASLTEVLSRIFGAVLGAVTQAAGAVADVAGDGARMVGDAAKEGAQMATGAAKQAGEAAGQAVGAAGDAAKEAGQKAADGAKAVGGAVADGAGKLVDGVKGLIPGK